MRALTVVADKQQSRVAAKPRYRQSSTANSVLRCTDMDRLHAYSLAPVVAVALLLFFSAVLHGRKASGLAAYCAGVAVWAGALILSSLPATSSVGQRLFAAGGFVVAGYLHSAHEVLDERRRSLVWASYAVACVTFGIQLVHPGWLVDPVQKHAGPLFWPSMALALIAAAAPIIRLVGTHRVGDAVTRSQVRRLLLAGLVGYAGAAADAIALAYGVATPIGPLVVLASLLMLARVVRDRQPAGQRKLLDRSLAYSALAGMLSAGFLLGMLALVSRSDGRVVDYDWTYDLGAWLLLATSAVAFEPLRRHVSDLVGSHLLGRPRSTELIEALERQEQRADHATRLAEIGSLTSAVAHEVRGPLGVITAQLRMLEKSGADETIIDDIRAQVRRTERFVDDMLRYGRPRPLELRSTDLSALAQLAVSTARSSLGDDAPAFTVDTGELPEGLLAEIDHAQLLQVLVILVDNALLASAERERCELRLRGKAADAFIELEVEDDGPGIPEEIVDRVFEPFVTGRKRKSPRPGTGLGLAIARNIVQRHGGTISAGRSELGGARFSLTLPRQAGIMGADDPEKVPA